MTRSTVIPRAPNKATARRSTPLAVTALSSSWISAYATREWSPTTLGFGGGPITAGLVFGALGRTGPVR